MVIDGKQLSSEIIDGLKKELLPIQEKKRLKIAVLVLAKSQQGLFFVKQKLKTAEKLGIDLKVFDFPADISEEELKQKIEKLNQDKSVQGIILQLPLPKNSEQDVIANFISPEKDVDGLTKNTKVLSPAVLTVKFILEKYRLGLKDKNVVIVGKGKLIGKPIADWFLSQGVAVRIIDRQTEEREKEDLIARADILISGVGKANLIKANLIKQGAVVIDFGYDVKDGRIFGDVERGAGERVGLFTPTPGGTGPILTAMIFHNLIALLEKSV